MSTSFLTQTRRLRRYTMPVVLLLMCGAVLGSFGLLWECHRYSQAVDRRLAHSAVFAARPRVRVVRSASSAGSLGGRSSVHPIRTVPAFDALPPALVGAVVSIEDRHFFEHGGVNYARTAECAMQNTIALHAVCGGSTITQQLARVDFLSPPKNTAPQAG